MVVRSSHAGLRNWLIQRITAVIIGLYFIFLGLYLINHQPVDFTQWHKLFDNILMKIATVITLLAILWHTWIGLWTVLTDYVKITGIRIVLQSLVIILLLGYVFWGIEILV